MLTFNQVSFNRNDKRILNDISASLESNRITTLIGPNGAGKTTLLQLITDDLKPSTGFGWAYYQRLTTRSVT